MTKSNSEIRELDIELLDIAAGGFRLFGIFQGPLIGTLIGGAIGGVANDGGEDSSRQAKPGFAVRKT